jgi:hypothetical protein
MKRASANVIRANVISKFQGTKVEDNITILCNLLTADHAQLGQHFERFLEIPFLGWNLATAFLVYLDPEEFLMVNEKTYPSLEKLGVRLPRKKSFEDYDQLRKKCIEIRSCSTKYSDGGFKDFRARAHLLFLMAVKIFFNSCFYLNANFLHSSVFSNYVRETASTIAAHTSERVNLRI